MISNMERYSRFLCQFEEASRDRVQGSELERLKEEYKDEIDSKRVLESIADVGTLLKVLEKRGVLQYDDVSVLRNIARQFVQDESVDRLIADYAQWLGENSGRISNCYSCGKSTQSSSSLDKVKKRAVIAKASNLVIDELEEQCEVLGPESSSSSSSNYRVVASPLVVLYGRSSLSPTISEKLLDRGRKNNAIVIIVSSLLLIIIIGVVWVLVKLSYQSAPAIVPKADPVMPLYASNINVGISVDPRFLVNQTQYHATAATLLNDNKEKQLQDRVANKIAKKIGRFWRDVSRRLNIEEAEIESIEMKYFNQEHGSKKMFKEALQLYFSENPRNWKLELTRALELSKRRDLKELVEELIHQPN